MIRRTVAQLNAQDHAQGVWRPDVQATERDSGSPGLRLEQDRAPSGGLLNFLEFVGASSGDGSAEEVDSENIILWNLGYRPGGTARRTVHTAHEVALRCLLLYIV